MKFLTEIIIVVLLIGLFMFLLTDVCLANVDLTQCGINNNLAICSQTTEKIRNKEIKQAILIEKQSKEKDKSMSVNEFFNGLVMLVKNQSVEDEVIVKTSFEYDDNYFQSSLVKDYYSIDYKNGKWKTK